MINIKNLKEAKSSKLLSKSELLGADSELPVINEQADDDMSVSYLSVNSASVNKSRFRSIKKDKGVSKR